jgi:HPt (histidine-containing phosphotransfer) domain-containing protein
VAKLPRLQSLALCGVRLQELPIVGSTPSGSSSRSETAANTQPQQTAARISLTSGDNSAVSALETVRSLAGLNLNNAAHSIAGELASLSVLTGLKQLWLDPSTLSQQLQQEPAPLDPQVPPQWLAALTQLTQLKIAPGLLPKDAAAPFSTLQQLHELNFWGQEVESPSILQGLPPSLTKLQVNWNAPEDLSNSRVPALSSLTAMQELDLWSRDVGGSILPSFCASRQQLRVLKLAGRLSSGLLPALLAAMPRLPQLQELVVSNINGDVRPLGAADVELYDQLLPAAPQLTTLELSWVKGEMLPANCGQHLFAAGVSLPRLKQLVLGLPSDVWEWCKEDVAVAGYVDGMTQCLGRGDIGRLARCCPALEMLWIPGMVQRGVDMSPLLRLTALTELFVGGEAINDAVASGVLAQMTDLKELMLFCVPELTERGEAALATLKRTSLTYGPHTSDSNA